MLWKYARQYASLALALVLLTALIGCRAADSESPPAPSATATAANGDTPAEATPTAPTASVTDEPVTPTTAEPTQAAASPAGDAAAIDCNVDDGDFLLFDDESRGISFCYPQDWVIEDWVEESGFFVVSPDGFADSVDTSQIILLYPDDSVVMGDPFTWSIAFFTEIVPDAEPIGEEIFTETSDETRMFIVAGGTIADEPVLGVVSGLVQNGVAAMGIAYVYDTAQTTAVAEFVVASMETRPSRRELPAERVDLPMGEIVVGEWRADEPGAHALQVVDPKPLLIVAAASAGSTVSLLDSQGIRVAQFTASYLAGTSTSSSDGVRFGFDSGPPDVVAFTPEEPGDYTVLIEAYDSARLATGATYQLAVYPLEGPDAAVISSETFEIAPEGTQNHEFTVAAERPLLVYVRGPAGGAALRLATYDDEDNILTGNWPLLDGRLLQWLPRRDGTVRLEVTSNESSSAPYEIIVLDP